MRFMVMHKVDANMEADVPPSPELMQNMGRFIEENARSGVFLAGEGLRPSRTRTRLTFRGGRRTMLDGPYAGANELVAGCLLMRVASKADALGWAQRYAEVVGDVEMELGPVTEPWDLGFCPRPTDAPLRFLLLQKADRSTEAGVRPDRRQKAAMAALLAAMREAGVLLAAEGLQPSSTAVRLKFVGGNRIVLEGPFAESKELIAGFSILRLPSMADAIEQTTRFAGILGGDVEVDIRPLSESDDPAAD
jgi:hypothetical protein